MLKVLVCGVTGMLGNAVFRVLSRSKEVETFGTQRQKSLHPLFAPHDADKILMGIEAAPDPFSTVLSEIKPDVVINCIGVVKQLTDAKNPLKILPLNSLFPHHLAGLCATSNARLIHISTDCVFSGSKGNYSEGDTPDARDLYGLSKFLGEVDAPNCITLRTSIVGHELGTQKHGLIDWFLSSEGQVKGFKKAIFSGLPTNELARVILKHVIPNPALSGLYQVAAAPIAKYDLLKIVAEVYSKKIEIVPDNDFAIDRSLNGSKFSRATGYVAPPWPDLIRDMRDFSCGDFHD
jgi:dTDP-4-dehydrorhamnose reductase